MGFSQSTDNNNKNFSSWASEDEVDNTKKIVTPTRSEPQKKVEETTKVDMSKLENKKVKLEQAQGNAVKQLEAITPKMKIVAPEVTTSRAFADREKLEFMFCLCEMVIAPNGTPLSGFDKKFKSHHCIRLIYIVEIDKKPQFRSFWIDLRCDVTDQMKVLNALTKLQMKLIDPTKIPTLESINVEFENITLTVQGLEEYVNSMTKGEQTVDGKARNILLANVKNIEIEISKYQTELNKAFQIESDDGKKSAISKVQSQIFPNVLVGLKKEFKLMDSYEYSNKSKLQDVITVLTIRRDKNYNKFSQYKTDCYYTRRMSLIELINLAANTFWSNGDYDYVFNNCRHYSKQLFNELTKGATKLDLDVNKFEKIHETFRLQYDGLGITKRAGTVKNIKAKLDEMIILYNKNPEVPIEMTIENDDEKTEENNNLEGVFDVDELRPYFFDETIHMNNNNNDNKEEI